MHSLCQKSPMKSTHFSLRGLKTTCLHLERSGQEMRSDYSSAQYELLRLVGTDDNNSLKPAGCRLREDTAAAASTCRAYSWRF